MHSKSDSTRKQPPEARGHAPRLPGHQEEGVVVDSDELAALRAILEQTARDTGEAFFESLVQHLSTAIGVNYAFVAEFADNVSRVRTLAYSGKGQICENIEYDLAGTPCEAVVRGELCHHPSGVRERFPRDLSLVAMGIESYLGVPLLDARGEVLGHLAVFDERPMPEDNRRLFVFRVFAARAAAELERLYYERKLRESEERYRDLYDEAPIGYVQEDLESRFIAANRAAIRILGIKPDEVAGTVGTSLVPNTPEAQRRARRGAPVGRPRHGHRGYRSRASPQGRRQTRVGPVVVQAGTARALHADHDCRHYRSRADGAGKSAAPSAKPVLAGRDQVGLQLRRDCRPKLSDHGGTREGPPSGGDGRDRAHHR